MRNGWRRQVEDDAGLAGAGARSICRPSASATKPAGLAGEALDKHTLAWADAINQSGGAYVTPATLDGRWMVRVSIGAMPTEREDVAALWKLAQESAASVGQHFLRHTLVRHPPAEALA